MFVSKEVKLPSHFKDWHGLKTGHVWWQWRHCMGSKEKLRKWDDPLRHCFPQNLNGMTRKKNEPSWENHLNWEKFPQLNTFLPWLAPSSWNLYTTLHQQAVSDRHFKNQAEFTGISKALGWFKQFKPFHEEKIKVLYWISSLFSKTKNWHFTFLFVPKLEHQFLVSDTNNGSQDSMVTTQWKHIYTQ